MNCVTPLATPCRIWRGTRVAGGYGRRQIKNKDWLVHRWIWTQLVGPIPAGMHVLHRCDNPPCYRLDHLMLGTALDNSNDKIAKGRQARVAGERNGWAKLSDAAASDIWNRKAAGERTIDLAAEFGVSEVTIREVASGRRWSAAWAAA